MRKVAFFDRDGVINDDTGHYYIYKPSDFKFNEGVIEALKLLVSNGYDIVIITNQGGIARGTYTKDDVKKVHDYLLGLLKDNGIEPLAIYYCPHHNEFEKCLCRKPSGLMIEKAMARYNVNSSESFMIGDNKKDIEAAGNAGIKGYKIETNANCLPLIEQLINE